MTDQQEFATMLLRNGITVRKRQSIDEPTLTILEIDHSSDKVDTMSHCFCEFRFHADGSLAQISFGY